MSYQTGSLLLAVVLASTCQGIPFQCTELTNIIASCSCESAFIDQLPDNTRVIINCRRLGLTQVPLITGSSNYTIYEMTLAGNNLQSIPAEAFKGLRIQRLDITDNRLTTIDVNAFRGLESSLQELNIGGDKGASVQFPLSSLTNLTGLHTLILEYFRFPNNEVVRGGLNLLSSLEILTLRHNALVYLETESVPLTLVSLELDHQDIGPSLPVNFLQHHTNLEVIKITNTNIRTLTPLAFERSARLRELDLGYNKINLMENDCFVGLTTTLHYLSLRNNPISTVSVLDNIRDLRSLQTLQLSEVGLSGTLPASAPFLENKASLLNLVLEGNTLTMVAENAFASASSLQSLSLAHNQLASMHDGALRELTKLTVLDLSYQTLPSGQTLSLPSSLAQIPALQKLVLSSTLVEENILWQRLSALTSLQVLQLERTGLSEVPDKAFRNMASLRELLMDNNNISTITQEKFVGPQNLIKLDLRYNQVQTISNCAFYQYHFDRPLELLLLENPLNCDCRLRWLVEQANKIQLGGFESCAAPPDKADKPLASIAPDSLTCSAEWTPDTCLDLYTTPAPTTTITTISPTVSITVVNVSKHSIRITWTTAHITGLSYFRVRITELASSAASISGALNVTQTSYTAQNLGAGKSYSLCVLAYSASDLITRACADKTTLADQAKVDGDDSSDDTYIIVGTVVAAVLLLVILVAIVYLVFLRKRTKEAAMAPQPHIFSPSELPSMGAEARRFTRPKQEPKVGRALDQENVKVTVISDGKTGPSSPGGRISAGSYQYLDQKHPQPFPEVTPSTSQYSNDVDGRALPSCPQQSYPAQGSNVDSMKGYYKMDSNNLPTAEHIYNQIDQ